MPVLLLVLLLAVPLTSGQNPPDTHQQGVALALREVNAHNGVQQHFLFYKMIQQSHIEAGFDVSYIYQNFYLKATKCKKGTENPDATKCPFRNDRPLIDCALCYKTFAGVIEKEPKPYLNCLHKPSLTEEMKMKRVEHCNAMSYSSGSPTLLSSGKPS